MDIQPLYGKLFILLLILIMPISRSLFNYIQFFVISFNKFLNYQPLPNDLTILYLFRHSNFDFLNFRVSMFKMLTRVKIFNPVLGLGPNGNKKSCTQRLIRFGWWICSPHRLLITVENRSVTKNRKIEQTEKTRKSYWFGLVLNLIWVGFFFPGYIRFWFYRGKNQFSPYQTEYSCYN